MKFFIKYAYLLLFYPVFILSLVVNLFSETGFLPERVIFAYFILYFIAVLIKNKLFKYIYIALIYFITLILSFIESSYVFLYKERISPSTAYILIETNSSEIKEYLAEYFSFSIFIILIGLLVPSFFILKGVKKLIYTYTFSQILSEIKEDGLLIFTNRYSQNLIYKIRTLAKNQLQKSIAVVIILVGLIFLYLKDNHLKYHAAYQFYEGYTNYKLELDKYQEMGNYSQYFPNISSNEKEGLKETFVLIIGESTTKNHMGIYDYYRNTNPELNDLKNELVVFKDVISPHSHTISSLEKVLTLGNYENPDKKHSGSVIQLMKQVGFKTYWFSNQVPVGVYETMVTSLAKKSDYTYFLNFGLENKMKSLDEDLLKHLTKALNEKVNKKFIVLHLMGTHTLYNNRYPKSYNKFRDVPKTNFPSENSFKAINEYDNAILYNDYVVSSIIKKVKNQLGNKEKAQVLYLSDHGEDVYETIDFNGHSESVGSRPMFQIPFIYWSNNAQLIKEYRAYSNRKFMTDNLIYCIGDINNLTFNQNDLNNSVFSPSFLNRKRLIKGDNDFDQ